MGLVFPGGSDSEESIFNAGNNETLDAKKEMELYKTEGTKLYFRLQDRISRAGAYKYAFRMFPKNKDLAHRLDFCYGRWFELETNFKI